MEPNVIAGVTPAETSTELEMLHRALCSAFGSQGAYTLSSVELHRLAHVVPENIVDEIAGLVSGQAKSPAVVLTAPCEDPRQFNCLAQALGSFNQRSPRRVFASHADKTMTMVAFRPADLEGFVRFSLAPCQRRR